MIIVCIFLVVLALDQLFRIRQGNLILEHRFRLYSLRDHLREAAMNEEFKSNNWVFQYLDSSIAKSIDILPTISVWRAIVLLSFARRSEKQKICFESLMRELEKEENAALLKFYLHYMAELGLFITRRHDTIYFALFSVFKITNGTKWLKSKLRLIKEVLSVAPETSTLPDFAG